MVLQCINGVGSNPVEGRNTVWFDFQTYIYIYIFTLIKFNFEYLLFNKWIFVICAHSSKFK